MTELSPEAIKKLADQGVTPEILAKILANLEKEQYPAQLSGFEGESSTGSLSLQDSDKSVAAEPPGSPPDSTTPYLTRARFVELKQHLTKRNLDILDALFRFRFLFTNQIQRLYFVEAKDKRTNTINANRMLKRLKEEGLIASLKRQSRGYRSGSISLIWHLTESGYRFLNLYDAERYARKRYVPPAPLFLEHTLAIAETAVQLVTICRASKDYSLKLVDTEPSCWRPYSDNGSRTYLKPDLYAVTVERNMDGENYEDSWFIEMDLGTESSMQVVEKCHAYLRYYKTGIEQEKNGVFPLVVWLVKDEARRNVLRQAIRDNVPSEPKMFIVITPDQVGSLIRQLLDRNELC